jgi:hypothetical protein
LYYLQSRYYNPEWGRFINADAIVGQTGELLAHNMFAYCKNNPINMADDEGYLPFWIGTTVAGAIFGVGNQLVSDIISGQKPTFTKLLSATIGGATSGFVLGSTGNAKFAAAAGAAVSNLALEGANRLSNKLGSTNYETRSAGRLVTDIAVDTGTSYFAGKLFESKAVNKALPKNIKSITSKNLTNLKNGSMSKAAANRFRAQTFKWYVINEGIFNSAFGNFGNYAAKSSVYPILFE